MLLDIGNLLGEEKMLTLVNPEEAREIWLLLSAMDVDTNVTSQGYCGDAKANKAYSLKTELVHFGWKTIGVLKNHCRDIALKRNLQ